MKKLELRQLIREEIQNVMKEEAEARTKMGLYLMFSTKDSKLVNVMEFPNHSENEAVKKQIEAKGDYKLYYTDNPSDYLKFKGDGLTKYIGKTAKELGILNKS